MSSFNIPEEYYYTKDHEWAQVDENVVTVGITEFAQDSLGEVVYVELPEEGQKVTQGEPFGVVESVKAVSDLVAPVSGTVIEVNLGMTDNPGQLDARSGLQKTNCEVVFESQTAPALKSAVFMPGWWNW